MFIFSKSIKSHSLPITTQNQKEILKADYTLGVSLWFMWPLAERERERLAMDLTAINKSLQTEEKQELGISASALLHINTIWLWSLVGNNTRGRVGEQHSIQIHILHRMWICTASRSTSFYTWKYKLVTFKCQESLPDPHTTHLYALQKVLLLLLCLLFVYRWMVLSSTDWKAEGVVKDILGKHNCPKKGYQ